MSIDLRLNGCAVQPLGSYLKALGILRLVAAQADREARGWWEGNDFVLRSKLDREALLQFFLTEYCPTPALAPWNGGSGFYEKDRKVGIDALAATSATRFSLYREAIHAARKIVAKCGTKAASKADEDARRILILRECRNRLPDECVEWLDAAIAISADEKRAFAPILGTGGNEGRLDYTNNFMERIADLLVAPDKKTPVQALLANALFADPCHGLEDIAVGQYDPGRTGGANQGQGVTSLSVANPWTAVLTIEGAIGWASGIYRKQGVSYRSFLCSPFTVRPSAVGYGSATEKDEGSARAEIWTPVWDRPARYPEMQSLLREARASVSGKPAQTGFDFAQAVASLGVDRGIAGFVRYSLLKRRGDSYVAAPLGRFTVAYRGNADLIRELDAAVEALEREAKNHFNELPNSWPPLKRAVEEAEFQALMKDGPEQLIQAAAAFGGLQRWMLDRGIVATGCRLRPVWVDSCVATSAEARIAGALAFLRSREAGGMREHLTRGDGAFSWTGRDLAERMVNTLRRRVLSGGEAGTSPLRSSVQAGLADVLAFLEGRTEDALIEDLLYAFTAVSGTPHWSWPGQRKARLWSAYSILKQMFLPGKVRTEDQEVQIKPDLAIPSLLMGDRTEDALAIAIRRLRILGRQLVGTETGDVEDPRRLGAALLIPITGTDAGELLDLEAPSLAKLTD